MLGLKYLSVCKVDIIIESAKVYFVRRKSRYHCGILLLGARLLIIKRDRLGDTLSEQST